MSSIRVSAAATEGRCRATWLVLTMAAVVFSPAIVRGQRPSTQSWVAPERATRRSNPVPATSDVINRGRELFLRDCSQCHGKSGHGDGPLAGTLETRPADLLERAQSQSDGALFWKMSQGRGVMPRSTLSDKEKWTVIHYLRTLAPKP